MERNIDKSAFLKPMLSESSATNTVVESVEAPLEIKSDNVFEIKDLCHTFDKGSVNEYKLFDNFNLAIKDDIGKGEVITLMGGSGCGKSCILKMAAGLMEPQSGDILIKGKSIKEYGNIPMVFQAYSNYEWMTVVDNVALPMIIKGVPKKEAREKAMEIVKLVGLEQHANKYAKASNLSGGQLQRISIARCLASGSEVFFLDEATGALDIKMKREIQDLILKVYYESEFEPTIINVTHSIDEALYLSDKIVILKPNPCTIHRIMDIDYGTEKRGDWVLNSQKFSNYRNELESTLAEVCK